MSTFIKALFTGFFEAFLSVFGKSPEERAGIAETTVKQQAETIKTVEKANAVDRVNAGLSDSRLRVLTGQWQRPDS
jgi:hypothetical protein